MTPAAISATIRAHMDGWAGDLGLTAMIARGGFAPGGPATAAGAAGAGAGTVAVIPPTLPLDDRRRWTTYAWGGAIHILPASFLLPRGNLQLAWQHYNCGNPPLRVVPTWDFQPKTRKRSSDLRFLMAHLERRIKSKGRWTLLPRWKGNPPLTAEQANSLFVHAEDFFEDFRTMRAGERSSRLERVAQFEWTSCANLMREWVKLHPEVASDADGADDDDGDGDAAYGETGVEDEDEEGEGGEG